MYLLFVANFKQLTALFSRATIIDLFLKLVLTALQATGATEPEGPVAAEFARAAAALKEKLEEHSLCVEDKISK